MLGHLAPPQHGAGSEGDLVFAAQRPQWAGHGGSDGGEILLGGGEQFLALARPFAGEIPIAANDQTLTGIVWRTDLTHIAVPGLRRGRLEQRGLQRPVLGERLDRPARAGR